MFFQAADAAEDASADAAADINIRYWLYVSLGPEAKSGPEQGPFPTLNWMKKAISLLNYKESTLDEQHLQLGLQGLDHKDHLLTPVMFCGLLPTEEALVNTPVVTCCTSIHSPP